ncbi:Tripartite ATP-independent periplasmic transporters, DctQ component [Rhodobacteraceae bacterium THAF1]|uniref:TRAP transporter small permease n=1 Tax=Palleronia sp. THAF1 TaxID=2587842 RepID=UPI000F3C3F22|nr:TRAP transporter small permease [Palleronia sp. THAF1]QFU08015.1 Tripartite ATP-independent periplasmic transporter, DctQ component [Palleronia sp. THAF1]VDC27868.1 Tripartite ATP-independent periplasmic transporters, DctQ component [Rhodobacteraceae bacterium THAF1]
MLRRIERLLLDLAAAAIVALGLLITVSVVLRITVNSGIPDTVVMVAELMVAAILLPLAATVAARANIVVEVLSQHFPMRVQDLLVILGGIIGLLALIPLIWAGWKEAVTAIESGSFFFGQLNLPKWPGRVLFLIGVVLCWVRLAVQVVEDIRTVSSGAHIETENQAMEEV